ncbi:MAG TPA: TetR/AcrR family transcriptional regulator [Solirubrobacterales bacterium]|nr:TetR/AcrR family transcriptional regulator [Solirubrobacterales bacterium]
MAKGASKGTAKKGGKKPKAKAAAPAASPRLPAGRHGLPREFIVQNQRERIITALVDTVAERGYNETTVAHITKAASVSRRTFYEHFADKEACFLAAYEMVSDHIRASMQAAAESFEDWPQQVRAALATMLRFLAGEPELARLTMIEPIAAGGEIAARHRASMQGFVEILKAGRPEHGGEHPLPAATEETLVGGIVSLIVREISAGRAAQLEQLLPDLVELTLAPYVGAEEAERLARQP